MTEHLTTGILKAKSIETFQAFKKRLQMIGCGWDQFRIVTSTWRICIKIQELEQFNLRVIKENCFEITELSQLKDISYDENEFFLASVLVQ